MEVSFLPLGFIFILYILTTLPGKICAEFYLLEGEHNGTYAQVRKTKGMFGRAILNYFSNFYFKK